MGSRCRIVLFAPNEAAAANAADEAFDEVARIEQILTDYNPDSEAMQVMRLPLGEWHPISTTLSEILLISKIVNLQSDGAFDPTIGAITHLWRHTVKENRIPTEEELNLARGASGFENLEIDQESSSIRASTKGMILDFGGIGKGFAADRAFEVLSQHSYRSAMIDIGGDLVLGDPPPERKTGWKVEVQTGMGSTEFISLSNCGVATSGDIERHITFEGVRYSHILDPRTGIGLTEQCAVAVIAEDGTTADALASSYSVLGTENEALSMAFPNSTVRFFMPQD
jgi:thiamine biosynthesis lipoprotein